VVARRQLLVLHDRLVIGAAEVVHGGLRPDDGGIEGLQHLRTELHRDGRGARGGTLRVAGVQVQGVVAHQKLTLRVIHVASTLKT
jgi:hypothetical protein